MKNIGVTVRCSECSKKLRGSPSLSGGYHVSRHKNASTGKWCWGSRLTDHRLAVQEAGQ